MTACRYSQEFSQDTLRERGLQSRGLLHFGVFAAALGGEYDPATMLDGVVDEVRVCARSFRMFHLYTYVVRVSLECLRCVHIVCRFAQV